MKTRRICAAVSGLRCKSMAWHREDNWLWHIVFTDANNHLQPKWGTTCAIYGWTRLNILNTLCTLTGSNDEPNGPNYAF